MSFLQRVATVKANLQEAHDRRVKEAEERAEAKMAKAQTEANREKAKLQLQRDKINLKRELYEARIATQKANLALKKARVEAGDLTITERAQAVVRYFRQPPPKRKTTATKRR